MRTHVPSKRLAVPLHHTELAGAHARVCISDPHRPRYIYCTVWFMDKMAQCNAISDRGGGGIDPVELQKQMPHP